MRRQIPGCPIKHIEMSLSYFLSLLHLFITVLLSSYLFSLFHFLAILFLLYLPLLCVCECPSLILPPFFCLSATIGGVSEKNWTSPVKLVFCEETDGSLCVPDGSLKGIVYAVQTNAWIHTHTYTPIHICKGERTRGLFMLKQNEFLWVVDCYLWGNTLLSQEKCNLDCSMTNNELLGFFLEATAAAAFLSPSISSAYAQTLEHTRHNSPALMSLLLNGLTHAVNQTNSHKNID